MFLYYITYNTYNTTFLDTENMLMISSYFPSYNHPFVDVFFSPNGNGDFSSVQCEVIPLLISNTSTAFGRGFPHAWDHQIGLLNIKGMGLSHCHGNPVKIMPRKYPMKNPVKIL